MGKLPTGLKLLAVSLAAVLTASACGEDVPRSRAYKATMQSQLIGGDVAMARVGDYILENDRIRVAILDITSSPGPGVFGGTLVDADLVRPDARFRNGTGHDQFAEMFAFANLLTAQPQPDQMDVQVVADGSDGGDAVVRVSGEGAFFLDALNVFYAEAMGVIFNDLKMRIRIQTDYILSPGVSYVRMATRVTRVDNDPDCGDPDEFICDKECAGGVLLGSDGCPVTPCECAPEEAVTLTNFDEVESIFIGTLGRKVEGNLFQDEVEPGMVGGDFVFFGAQNDLFAPGMGFDEERPVFDGLFEGRDPFTYPLGFDYMAAAGGAVSYGYFTANPEDDPNDPLVLVPIITSSTTAFTTGVHNCLPTPNGEEPPEVPCQAFRAWEWERYFVVGKGDIASVNDVVLEVRGTPHGRLEGVVVDAIAEAEPNARIFILRDPDASVSWTDVRDVIAANWKKAPEHDPGVLNAIHADVGLDPLENGTFQAKLKPGTYLAVATNEAMTATSEVQRFTIREGQTTRITPMIPKPASLRYRVTDGQGQLLEAKLMLVSREGEQLATGDGLRRPAMGEGRIGNGVRHLTVTASGDGTIEIEPGDYRLFVTHGPTYSRAEVDFSVAPGREYVAQVTLHEEVDTTGWIGFDAHLHAEPSFDSGMKLDRRIISAVAEGLDLAISTDHDVVTDYAPTIRALDLHDRIKSGIGIELSTVESGHFIAFPLAYDALDIPDHNAPDWLCKDGQDVMDELADHMEPGSEGVRIIAHPRDGFTGYISQLEVDPFDMSRPDLNLPKLELEFGASIGAKLTLEGQNEIFDRATCDFEAMEVFNSKRFDQMRTPTNEEIVVFNRCMSEIEQLVEGDIDALEATCTEHKGATPIVPCTTEERFFDCKMRHRRALSKEMARRILERTPEEQALLWSHRTASADEARCSLDQDPDLLDAVEPQRPDMPCTEFAGVIEDWMRWLDVGMNVTVTAASDSHGLIREPGTPRTWVRHNAASPADIDVAGVARAVKDHHAVPSYGPFINATVNGAGPGDTATVAAGEPFTLDLRVQTASWFGVDRIEVYVSGELQEAMNLGHGPEAIIDYEGSLELTAPGRDGFVAVIVMGLQDKNLMAPTYLDIPFGELQLPRVAALAFGALPVLGDYFPMPALSPDFYPTFPMALTNAILLDVDGEGWRPAGDGPDFCSRPCVSLGPACGPGASPGPSCTPNGPSCIPFGAACTIDNECEEGFDCCSPFSARAGTCAPEGSCDVPACDEGLACCAEDTARAGTCASEGACDTGACAPGMNCCGAGTARAGTCAPTGMCEGTCVSGFVCCPEGTGRAGTCSPQATCDAEPEYDDSYCPGAQICLDEQGCGYQMDGQCTLDAAAPASAGGLTE